MQDAGGTDVLCVGRLRWVSVRTVRILGLFFGGDAVHVQGGSTGSGGDAGPHVQRGRSAQREAARGTAIQNTLTKLTEAKLLKK